MRYRSGSDLREQAWTDMTPDETERAYMQARYNVSDEELVARMNTASDMGGSLLVELNEFMEKAMTTEKIQAWREAGDIYLQDAQYECLSMPSRADAAFDACYMYARCIVGDKSELYSHPDTSVLNLAATELGWDFSVLRPVRQHLYRRYEPLRDGSQFDVLLALAVELKGAINTAGIQTESHK